LIKSLSKSQFVKNMSIIMSGTAVAQIIGFALTPIISRLFTPSDFGIFGSFNSVLGVVVAGVTLQYSQAIMLPKEDDDAANVFAVSMLSVLAVTLVGLLSAYVFSDWLLGLLKAPNSRWLLWFLPLGIFATGINQSVQAWCIRRKAFVCTSTSQVIRSVAASISQIILGIYKTGGTGLIIGAVTADGVASLNMTRQVLVADKVLIKNSLDWKSIRRLAFEYRDFPIYAATQHLMSALSQGLPVLLLSHFYGIAVAGAYAFGVRILQVPMNFVLTSLRQVLFQKACETHNQNGDLFALFKKTTLGLFVIAVVPALILILIAPNVFSWVFGLKWYQAGILARWLVVWQLVAFCNVPAAIISRILRLQRKLFFFEILILSSRFLTLLVGGFYLDVYGVVALFSTLGAMLNIAMIVWIWRVLKSRKCGSIVANKRDVIDAQDEIVK
jgi:lipopolysaccharide exporter